MGKLTWEPYVCVVYYVPTVSIEVGLLSFLFFSFPFFLFLVSFLIDP